MTRIISLFILIFGVTDFAYASRCDCSKRVGACAAQVEWKQNLITVKSSSKACSSVTWYADGDPLYTVVTGGIDEQVPLYIMPGEGIPKEIFFQSCWICKDENVPSTAQPTAQTPSTAQPSSPETLPDNNVASLYEGTWKCEGRHEFT